MFTSTLYDGDRLQADDSDLHLAVIWKAMVSRLTSVGITNLASLARASVRAQCLLVALPESMPCRDFENASPSCQ